MATDLDDLTNVPDADQTLFRRRVGKGTVVEQIDCGLDTLA